MYKPPEFLTESDWGAIVGILRLSEREGAIISSAMDGASETAIARILGISQHTVHTHLERLHRKLHVTTRPQLIARIFATYVDVVNDTAGTLPPPSPPVAPVVEG
jgi:DNA-binding CsgD family transcriptional regulator